MTLLDNIKSSAKDRAKRIYEIYGKEGGQAQLDRLVPRIGEYGVTNMGGLSNTQRYWKFVQRYFNERFEIEGAIKHLEG